MITVRLAGQDLMVRLPHSLDVLRPFLLDLSHVPDPGELVFRLLDEGFTVSTTQALNGQEEFLIRLAPGQAIIRHCGDNYAGTWGSAPVVEILGKGAWVKGVDESIRALQALQKQVLQTVVDPHVAVAISCLLEGRIATRRASR